MAAALGEPAPVLAEELAIRRAAALPPFVALWPLVSGALAPAYAEALRRRPAGGPARGVDVSALAEDRFLVQAPDHGRCATCWPRAPARRAAACGSRSTRRPC